MQTLPHEDCEKSGKTGFGLPENDDEGTMCTFYPFPEYMSHKSKEEDRPVYENRDYICITSPGQKNSIVRRRVRPEDKERFPAPWKAYKEQTELIQDMTPIEELPRILRTRALELKVAGIPTVEALAKVPDGKLKNLGPDTMSLKKQALAWLRQTNSAEAKVKEQEVEIKKQAEQIKELTSRIEELTAKVEQKPKRGRPKKNVTADASAKCA